MHHCPFSPFLFAQFLKVENSVNLINKWLLNFNLVFLIMFSSIYCILVIDHFHLSDPFCINHMRDFISSNWNHHVIYGYSWVNIVNLHFNSSLVALYYCFGYHSQMQKLNGAFHLDVKIRISLFCAFNIFLHHFLFGFCCFIVSTICWELCSFFRW